MLQPTDSVDYNHPQLGVISKTVLDVLRLKHPDPSIPPASVLPSFDNLPYLEDVEITGAHIQSVACQLQGVVVQVDVKLLTGKIFCCSLVVLVPRCVTLLLLFVVDYVTPLLLGKIFVLSLLVALLLLTNAQVFDL